MEDILLLEDYKIYQDMMVGQIPEGLTHRLVSNGHEFEKYLADGGQARLYFLDDEVQDASGTDGFHFIKHCSHLLKQRPEAKVFYHGSIPLREEFAYCEKHNIQLINRSRIGDIIRQELAK